MREALSKRSSSQRPSRSTSQSAALKSRSSSKKKTTSGRAHSRPLIQAKSKRKASSSKATAKSAASRTSRAAKRVAARSAKTAPARKPVKATVRAAKTSKPTRTKGAARSLKMRQGASSKATRGAARPRTGVATSKVSVRSQTRTATTQKGGKQVRLHVPSYVERVVPLETPRRKPASGALKAFEHAVRVFNKRQFGEARELFDLVQRRFPQEVEIVARSHTYIQVCSQRMQRPPSSPRSADELYDRGVFHLNIGDFAQARQLFEKALRLSPDEPHLLYSLAASHARSGSHEEALTFLDQVVQEHPRFRTQALNDSDFADLYENKRFLEILGVSSLLDIIDSRREP